MSGDFKIAETESFQKLVRAPRFESLYLKINDYIYPQLRQNPFFGKNIKKLKGNLSHFYRYRIGNYRLFYIVESDKKIIFITTISDRKDSY